MWEKVSSFSNEAFKRHTGVSRNVFEKMVWAMHQREDNKVKRGRPSSFSFEEQLLIALEYWREYRTYFHIANSWGTQESTVSRIVRRVEDALMANDLFHLVGKKKLLEQQAYEVIVVDATEVPVERPKKKQRKCYSGKKKKHTLKAQVAVDHNSKKILAVACEKGACHDFKKHEK